MSRRTPPPEALDALREVFRKSPPSIAKDFRAAAALAGVHESDARRSWARGWIGIEPIEVQLARERALQSQSAELLRVENIVRAATMNAASLQAELLHLRPVVQTLSKNLLVRSDELANLDPAATVTLLVKLAKVHKDISTVSQRAVELRRLVDGEATSIVGVKKIEHEAVDLEQARTTNDQLARAVQRAERLLAGTTDGAIEREMVRLRTGSDDGTN